MQHETPFTSDIMSDIKTFLSCVPTYDVISCCTSLCSCCGDIMPIGDTISTHHISPQGLNTQGYKIGINSCSKPLCLENFAKAQRFNYMSNQQLFNRIGTQTFEFQYCDGLFGTIGPLDTPDTWQVGACVREEGEEYRIFIYMAGPDGIGYRFGMLFLSDVLELNPQ